MTPPWDCAVVGGGVAGLCGAALFARAGARVVLIEPHLDATPPAGPLELRNYALTPAAQRVLDAAGAWSHVEAARLGRFSAMEVWDARSFGAIEFHAAPGQAQPLGWIAEHRNLVAACHAVASSWGLTHRARRLEGLDCGREPHAPATLMLDDGTALQARLVIGADGMDSSVRERAGIGWRRTAYGQRALVANVTTSIAHGNVARQRFLTSGPLAFLPLPDAHASSIVWSCTSGYAAELEALEDSAFRGALGSAFEHRLGTLLSTTVRAAYPLGRARAEHFVRGAVALVGDAAHMVHPLAGQGLNLGLLDVAALLECVGAPGTPGWPRPAALRRYERWRKSEALALTLVTDTLNRLFARDDPASRLLRGVGLRLTDASAPLKAALRALATGERGDLPQIARTGRPFGETASQ